MGYSGFWMGYFAARSAPLGQVPADVVTAVFYNFSAERVAKALPAAWDDRPAGRMRCGCGWTPRWPHCVATG